MVILFRAHFAKLASSAKRLFCFVRIYLPSSVNHTSNPHFVRSAPLLDAMPSSLVLQLYHSFLQLPQLDHTRPSGVSPGVTQQRSFDFIQVSCGRALFTRLHTLRVPYSVDVGLRRRPSGDFLSLFNIIFPLVMGSDGGRSAGSVDTGCSICRRREPCPANRRTGAASKVSCRRRSVTRGRPSGPVALAPVDLDRAPPTVPCPSSCRSGIANPCA